jgi:hypothetical protein
MKEKRDRRRLCRKWIRIKKGDITGEEMGEAKVILFARGRQSLLLYM